MMYLKSLFKNDRPLFYVITTYLLFTVFFNLTGDEVTPFFVWGMFSQQEKVKESYDIFEIKVDGEVYDYANIGTDFRRHYTKTPLHYYYKMSKLAEDPTRHFFKSKTGAYYPDIATFLEPITNDQSEFDAYPAWLDRYLEEVIDRPIQTLEVSVLTVQYQPDTSVKVITKKPLFKHEG